MPDRYIAAQFIFDLFDGWQALDRRVETIGFPDRNLNSRRVSLDFDADYILRLCDIYKVELDVLPLAIIQKGLLADLDVENAAGKRLSVVSRDLDSALSRSLLLGISWRVAGAPESISLETTDRLADLLRRFQPSDAPPVDPAEFAVQSATDAASDDPEWWHAAIASEEWCRWFATLSHNFMLTARIDKAMLESRLFKYRVTEPRLPAAMLADGVRSLVEAKADPSKTVVLRVPDLGRARSEHIRVHPPVGLFVGFGLLVRQPGRIPGASRELISYRLRRGRSALSFYLNESEARDTIVTAQLWPEPRSFVAPARVLSWYLAAYVFALMLVAFEVEYATALRSWIGGVISMSVLVPTAALGYLSRPDDNGVRWGMLARLRSRIFRAAAIALASLAGFLLITPIAIRTTQGMASTAVGTCLAAVCLFMLWSAAEIDRRARRVTAEFQRIAAAERLPAKGQRHPVKVTWTSS